MLKKINIRTAALTILCCVTSVSIADTQRMSLPEYLQNALNNDQVKQIILDERVLTDNYIIDRDMDDWSFTLGAGNTFLLSQGNASSPVLSAATSKLILNTGTEFAASYSRTRSSVSSKDQNKIDISINQPLFQNHFGYQNRIKEEKLKKSRDLSRLQVIESYETYYMELMNLYYDWYLAYMERESAIKLYKDYDLLFKDILARKKNHIARDLDVNKVKVQLLEKRENLIAQKNNFKTYTDKIRKTINVDVSDLVVPVIPDPYELDVLEGEESLLLRSRTEAELQLDLVVSSLDLKIERDNLNVPVDFEASYQLTNYPDGSSSDQSTLYSGVSLPFPFYNRQDKASVRLANTVYSQLILEQEEARRDWFNTLRQLQNAIADEEEYLEIYRRKVEYLTSIATDEKKNYLRGQASLNELIQAMGNLENAEKKAIQHQVQLEKYKIEWLALTDKLIQDLL